MPSQKISCDTICNETGRIWTEDLDSPCYVVTSKKINHIKYKQAKTFLNMKYHV